MARFNGFADWAQHFRTGLAAAAGIIGEDEKQAIRQSISVPQEHTSDGTIRSSPGQPPRAGARSHPLLDSVQFASASDVQGVTICWAAGPVMSDLGIDYATVLEVGGTSVSNHPKFKGKPVEPRPFMRPSMDRTKATVGAKIRQLLGG